MLYRRKHGSTRKQFMQRKLEVLCADPLFAISASVSVASQVNSVHMHIVSSLLFSTSFALFNHSINHSLNIVFYCSRCLSWFIPNLGMISAQELCYSVGIFIWLVLLLPIYWTCLSPLTCIYCLLQVWIYLQKYFVRCWNDPLGVGMCPAGVVIPHLMLLFKAYFASADGCIDNLEKFRAQQFRAQKFYLILFRFFPHYDFPHYFPPCHMGKPMCILNHKVQENKGL